MKKIIAPLVITILLVLYFIGYGLLVAWGLSFTGIAIPFLVLGFVIPLALAGVSIMVLIQRIKEIRSGEEDDLSKY